MDTALFPAPMGEGVAATFEVRPLYGSRDLALTESITRLNELDKLNRPYRFTHTSKRTPCTSRFSSTRPSPTCQK